MSVCVPVSMYVCMVNVFVLLCFFFLFFCFLNTFEMYVYPIITSLVAVSIRKNGRVRMA